MLQQEITNQLQSEFRLGEAALTLQEYNALVNSNARLSSEIAPSILQKLSESVDLVTDAVIDNKLIYGITTGFGGMSGERIDCQHVAELQTNLLAFLAAGAGAELAKCHTAGAMLLRASVLLQGKSGVRAEVIQRLIEFFRHDVIPVVRELGSIGASGDLIPLATIARAITGQSGRVTVRIDNEKIDSGAALQRLGLMPIELRAKEGLALVNGTSFSSAIAANATVAACQSLTITFVVQSMLMTALKVDPNPFASFVHECKPHPGQIWSAGTMRDLLTNPNAFISASNDTVQDRYSMRCFAQYNGPIVEGLARIVRTVETEMNSVSDNPLVDPEHGVFYQSGNFLGQYIGIAMDDLRRFIGLLAKHLDVQIASLVAPEFNRGLSPSLRGNEDIAYNMGLKGLQICGNSIVPMLTHFANPLVEHYPTHAEQFNQNVNGLSWGAANLAWNSVELYQQYLAVASLFSIQAIDMRSKGSLGHFDGRELLGEVGRTFYDAICKTLSIEPSNKRPYLFDDSDRWLEQDVEKIGKDIARQGLLVDAVDALHSSFIKFSENQK